MKPQSPLKVVDFFCGGGGISTGMQQAGLRVVGALDNDPDCKETYLANHPNVPFVDKDITTLRTAVLKQEFSISQNDENLLFVGCAPCQYWSIINGRSFNSRKQSAYGSRNLLLAFLRFVKYYRPGYVLIENVSGITANPEESGLLQLRAFLKNKNYYISDDVLYASRHGVPQTRRRYILVASRVLPVNLPVPETRDAVVRDVISDMPKIEAGGEPSADDPLHRSQALQEINIKRLQLTPEGGLRSHWVNRDDLMLDAYRNKPLSFFRENYGRMAWNEPAPTITTKFHNIGCGRFAHPDPAQHRSISLREGALLQTFPPEYEFKTNSFASTAKLIGNAFPPELARRIGEALR